MRSNKAKAKAVPLLQDKWLNLVKVFCMVAMALAALIFLTGMAMPKLATEYRTYVVQPGDTLHSIASRYMEQDEGKRALLEVVDDIEAANDMGKQVVWKPWPTLEPRKNYSKYLQAGQVLIVPVEVRK